MAAVSDGGFESTSLGCVKRCCSCNGDNARCKSCICVKSKRVCSCCLLMKQNRCANSKPISGNTLAESNLPRIDATLPAVLVTTLEVPPHELGSEVSHESVAAVSNESNNAAVSLSNDGESSLSSDLVLHATDLVGGAEVPSQSTLDPSPEVPVFSSQLVHKTVLSSRLHRAYCTFYVASAYDLACPGFLPRCCP